MTGSPDTATELALRRRIELLSAYVEQVSDYIDRRARELGYWPLPDLDGEVDP